MNTKTKAALKNSLQSPSGVHLSMYLQNPRNEQLLKNEIRSLLETATQQLENIKSPKEIQKFLDPIYKLLENPFSLGQMSTNFAILRSSEIFRLIAIPTPVETFCTVASSFHIKPILRWLQYEEDFYLVSIDRQLIRIFEGSQSRFRLIDSIVLSGHEASNEDICRQIETSLKESLVQKKHRVFFTGTTDLAQEVFRRSQHPKKHFEALSAAFSERSLDLVLIAIRKKIMEEIDSELKFSISEFYWAEENNRAKKNLIQIAKYAVKGQIKKLIVADGFHIFGKIDQFSGGVRIHPVDLDHEDDDLLDDIAQIVLEKGGQVVVIPYEKMPKNRPALAILKDFEDERSLYAASRF